MVIARLHHPLSAAKDRTETRPKRKTKQPRWAHDRMRPSDTDFECVPMHGATACSRAEKVPRGGQSGNDMRSSPWYAAAAASMVSLLTRGRVFMAAFDSPIPYI